MKSRFKIRAKIKSLLLLIIMIKIMITFVFFSGSTGWFDTILKEQAAIAEETSSEKPLEGNTGTDPDQASGETSSNQSPQTSDPTSANLRGILEGLEEKRLEILKEEEQLAQKRLELEMLKKEIEAKIKELTTLHQKIEASIRAQKKNSPGTQFVKDTELAQYKQLVKVYTSMKPKTAAGLIDKLDMEVILKLFSIMKGEQIGSILAYVNTDKAARISERLAKIK